MQLLFAVPGPVSDRLVYVADALGALSTPFTGGKAKLPTKHEFSQENYANVHLMKRYDPKLCTEGRLSDGVP